MRTAEEILKYDLGIKEGASISFEMAVIALNKARKEAIGECAEIAKTYANVLLTTCK